MTLLPRAAARRIAPLLLLAACQDAPSAPDAALRPGAAPRADVLPSPALYWYFQLDGGGAGSVPWGLPTDTPVPADYDGDGRTDPAVWRASERWLVLRSADLTTTQTLWGDPNDVPVPADYDGDGKADVAVWRPATGQWWILPTGGGAQRIEAFGTAGDVPVPGDFDGDGKADLAVWRPSNRFWYAQRSTAGFMAIQWGLSDDVPVRGDFVGGAGADPAVFRPSTATWWALDPNTGAVFQAQWGLPGDVPMAGDYDGDARTDAAVYRPSNATWYVRSTADGAQSAVPFGLPGDTPVPYVAGGRARPAVVRVQTPPTYPFAWAGPTKAPPALNSGGAGGVVPVQFSLGGDRGSAVLAAGSPSSVRVSCDDPTQTIGAASATATDRSLVYLAEEQSYRYLWRTESAWSGTCRLFTLQLTDGSTREALYRFR
ncbi:PxKF domain-containing protein [Roseisolibacter sp. H3M3-2]|uniref:PxKF domain-containing protein n=1 Tax=Roseisolibacter sp. H3M3-2 TaxID=3031323 RepID=UPI0023D980C4|nr:PxKF domain-containing protein [Roseisolibacter sp. H3M3-2]MDF1504962.1 PxKF domain-containing protein [Roseisolibacter sp. H3M3-2]